MTPAGLGALVSPQTGKMRGRGADGGQACAQPWVLWEPSSEPEWEGAHTGLRDSYLLSCAQNQKWGVGSSSGHKAGQGPREPPTQAA